MPGFSSRTISKDSDHLPFRWSYFLGKPGKGPEGKADCAASLGGIWPLAILPTGLPPSEAGAGKDFFGAITEHPRPSQRKIRALGLQAICFSFRAPQTIGHFLYSDFFPINKWEMIQKLKKCLTFLRKGNIFLFCIKWREGNKHIDESKDR
jgi:hypothetical protein